MTQLSLPFTYADILNLEDMDPLGGDTASDLQNLVQDCYHALIELPGTNQDDPYRGVGIMNYLSGNTQQFASLPKDIETDFLRDDRIDTCSCSITTDVNDAQTPYRVSIQIGVDGTVLPLDYLFGPAGLFIG